MLGQSYWQTINQTSNGAAGLNVGYEYDIAISARDNVSDSPGFETCLGIF